MQLNEIEKDLPACSAKVLLESKWTFITQEVCFFILYITPRFINLDLLSALFSVATLLWKL